MPSVAPTRPAHAEGAARATAPDPGALQANSVPNAPSQDTEPAATVVLGQGALPANSVPNVPSQDTEPAATAASADSARVDASASGEGAEVAQSEAAPNSLTTPTSLTLDHAQVQSHSECVVRPDDV